MEILESLEKVGRTKHSKCYFTKVQLLGINWSCISPGRSMRSLSLVVKRSCCGPYLAFCYFDCTFENVSKTSACLQIFHVQIYFPWNLLICMLKFIFNGTMTISTKLQAVWPREQDILPDTFGLWARTAQGRAARINSDKAEVHTSLGGLLASEANFSCFGLLAVAEKRIRKYSHAYWTWKTRYRDPRATRISLSLSVGLRSSLRKI